MPPKYTQKWDTMEPLRAFAFFPTLVKEYDHARARAASAEEGKELAKESLITALKDAQVPNRLTVLCDEFEVAYSPTTPRSTVSIAKLLEHGIPLATIKECMVTSKPGFRLTVVKVGENEEDGLEVSDESQ